MDYVSQTAKALVADTKKTKSACELRTMLEARLAGHDLSAFGDDIDDLLQDLTREHDLRQEWSDAYERIRSSCMFAHLRVCRMSGVKFHGSSTYIQRVTDTNPYLHHISTTRYETVRQRGGAILLLPPWHRQATDVSDFAKRYDK